MLRTRIIPTLLLRNESLVKTVRFGRFTYIGDPCNTVRIFNELEVDELLFLDITATTDGRSPNLRALADIADECFMPLGYGGGIRSLADAKAVFEIGFEKIALNSAAIADPNLVRSIADTYGSQAVIVSIDVRKDFRGRYRVVARAGAQWTKLDPVDWAREVQTQGAGEILLTAVDREGSWSGFDIDLVRQVADAVSVPVIAQGGAGTVNHIGDVVRDGHASAVALGSMVVFQKKGMGVLVSFPDQTKLSAALSVRSV